MDQLRGAVEPRDRLQRPPRADQPGRVVRLHSARLLAGRLSRPRGFVVVTGSELVRGDRRDANGPFLAAELLRLGVEPARIAIVGDDPEELEAVFR
ncbi:MAG: molybdopterin-binding protein, partial [Gaiellaceae bacterium]